MRFCSEFWGLFSVFVCAACRRWEPVDQRKNVFRPRLRTRQTVVLLIDDLLDLTRIDRGKIQLNFEVVDAHTLLQNALEICQAEIDRKHLTRSLNLGAHKMHMRADPARLQQIFWNLINNAVKFTPRNGQIIITTTNDSQGQSRVEIVDTGLGIEPETLPKIFDAFEQGGRTQLGAWA